MIRACLNINSKGSKINSNQNHFAKTIILFRVSCTRNSFYCKRRFFTNLRQKFHPVHPQICSGIVTFLCYAAIKICCRGRRQFWDRRKCLFRMIRRQSTKIHRQSNITDFKSSITLFSSDCSVLTTKITNSATYSNFMSFKTVHSCFVFLLFFFLHQWLCTYTSVINTIARCYSISILE